MSASLSEGAQRIAKQRFAQQQQTYHRPHGSCQTCKWVDAYEHAQEACPVHNRTAFELLTPLGFKKPCRSAPSLHSPQRPCWVPPVCACVSVRDDDARISTRRCCVLSPPILSGSDLRALGIRLEALALFWLPWELDVSYTNCYQYVLSTGSLATQHRFSLNIAGFLRRSETLASFAPTVAWSV